MVIVIFTPIRLLGEGIALSLAQGTGIVVGAITSLFSGLREVLGAMKVDLVVVDVTQGVDLEEVYMCALEWPTVPFLALGLEEQHQEVIRHGQAGFSGYVSRDTSVDALRQAIFDTVNGCLCCSAQVSGGLMRALFRPQPSGAPPSAIHTLSPRENEVMRLIGRALSNKEIARELNISIATVKHHVHNILEKLSLFRRTQVMRQVRDTPWSANTNSLANRELLE
jgi:two-component system nitrate/nitrite response regulator NarL